MGARWVATGVAAALLATPAAAQLSRQGGPIQVSGDRIAFDSHTRATVYEGRVEVVQGDTRLRADVVRSLFGGGAASGGVGDLRRLEADGSVFLVTPTQVVRGDHAIYSPAEDLIEVTGDVVVRQGDNVTSGQRLVIHVRAGTSALTGAAAAGGGARVRGVLAPRKAETAAAQP